MKKLLSTLLSIALLTCTLSAPAMAVVDYGAEYQNQPTATYTQVFKDVDKSYWAFSYIEEMNARGVLSGYPNGYFYPENNVTRAEFAKIMTIASSLPLDTTSGGVFADVGENDWFKPYVYTAQYYLNGYNMNGGVYYLPNTNALREDIAVALVKLKGYDTTGYDESMLKAMFKDYLSISDYARPYVATALEKGLISGYEDNTFRGQNSITRAEAATLLWRAYQYGSGNKVSTDMTPYVPAATPAPSVSIATPIPTVAPNLTPVPAIVPTLTPTTEPTTAPTPEPEYTWSVDTLVDDVKSIYDMDYCEDGIVYQTSKQIIRVSFDGDIEVLFDSNEYKDEFLENAEEMTKLDKADVEIELDGFAVNHYTDEVYVAIGREKSDRDMLLNVSTDEVYTCPSVGTINGFFSDGELLMSRPGSTTYIISFNDDGTVDEKEVLSSSVNQNYYVIDDNIYNTLNQVYNWSEFENIDVDNKDIVKCVNSKYLYKIGIVNYRGKNLLKMTTSGDSEIILSTDDLIEVKDRATISIADLFDKYNNTYSYIRINDDDTIFFYDENSNSIRMLERL